MTLDQDPVMLYVLDKCDEWGIEKPDIYVQYHILDNNDQDVEKYCPFSHNFINFFMCDETSLVKLRDILRKLHAEDDVPESVHRELKKQIQEFNLYEFFQIIMETSSEHGMEILPLFNEVAEFLHPERLEAKNERFLMGMSRIIRTFGV